MRGLGPHRTGRSSLFFLLGRRVFRAPLGLPVTGAATVACRAAAVRGRSLAVRSGGCGGGRSREPSARSGTGVRTVPRRVHSSGPLVYLYPAAEHPRGRNPWSRPCRHLLGGAHAARQAGSGSLSRGPRLLREAHQLRVARRIVHGTEARRGRAAHNLIARPPQHSRRRVRDHAAGHIYQRAGSRLARCQRHPARSYRRAHPGHCRRTPYAEVPRGPHPPIHRGV